MSPSQQMQESIRSVLAPHYLFHAALLPVLYFRIRSGVDLTDEMQHYGELTGLLATGRLFSTDLFFQQTAWIPFYPILKPFHALFGESHLILFARTLLAALIVAIYLRGFASLRRFGLGATFSAMGMFCATFAVTWGNIFSIHYNTVAQIVLLIFALKLFNWDPESRLSAGDVLQWSFLPFLAAFGHPVIAISIALMMTAWLCGTGNWQNVKRLIAGFFVAATAGLAVTFLFTTPAAIFESLTFSKGFDVGRAIFGSTDSMALIGLFLLAMSAALFVNIPVKKHLCLAIFLITLVFTVVSFATGMSSVAITETNTRSFILMTASLTGFLRSSGHHRQLVMRLATVIFVMSMVYGVTSGNGPRTMMASLALIMPLLSVLALHDLKDNGLIKGNIGAVSRSVVMIGLTAMFVLYWTQYPYRTARWYLNDTPAGALSPMFSGLHIHAETFEYLSAVKRQFADLRNQKVLITGRYPILHYVLETIPETCMFFMHTIPDGQANVALKTCLKTKHPERILFVDDPSTPKEVANAVVNLYAVDYESCHRYNAVFPVFHGMTGYHQNSTYLSCSVESRIN